jgi:hypothetical protein
MPDRGHQQRIAGQEEAHEQASLREHDRGDECQATDANQALHVVDPMKQIDKVVHAGETLSQAGSFVTFEMLGEMVGL